MVQSESHVIQRFIEWEAQDDVKEIDGECLP